MCTPRDSSLSGRELDAAVAVRLGHEIYDGPVPQDDLQLIEPGSWCCVPGYGSQPTTIACPHFSTDIAAAWTLVEQMRERGFIVRVQEMPDGLPFLSGSGWGPEDNRPLPYRTACILHSTPALAERRPPRDPVGLGETAPEALCRAFLACCEAGR